MHNFIRKIVLAAGVVTLAGMAGATQVKADSAVASNSSWFNSYAAGAGQQTQAAAPTEIVISKSWHRPIVVDKNPKARGHKRKKAGRVLSQAHKLRRHRLRTHASGYSW